MRELRYYFEFNLDNCRTNPVAMPMPYPPVCLTLLSVTQKTCRRTPLQYTSISVRISAPVSLRIYCIIHSLFLKNKHNRNNNKSPYLISMCGWGMSAVSSYIPIAVSKVLVVILKSRGSTSCNFCSLLIKSSNIVLLLKNSGCPCHWVCIPC
jgi:hypothetical protein